MSIIASMYGKQNNDQDNKPAPTPGKWAVTAGPRKQKPAAEALEALLHMAKHTRERYGVIGGKETESLTWQPFNPHQTPAIIELYNAVGERFGWSLTNDNCEQVRAAAVEACKQAHPLIPVNDHRKSPEQDEAQRAEWAKQSQEQENKAAERRRRVEALAADIRKQYPWAIPQGKMSNQAWAAANIREMLKREYPGVAFSIRSKSFSMGDDVYVSWTDGPTCEQVDAIVKRFQRYSHTDMTDYAHMNESDEFKAWSGVMGHTKYTSTSREFSEQHKAEAERLYVETFPNGTNSGGGMRGGDYERDCEVRNKLAHTPLMPGARIVGWGLTIANHDDYKGLEVEIPAPRPTMGCRHNEMIKSNEPGYAWKCAQCGYVYGKDSSEKQSGYDPARVSVQQHYHTKRGTHFYICVLADRVERDRFEELRDSCKRAGGWYSRQWGSTPGGFAFESQDVAAAWAAAQFPAHDDDGGPSDDGDASPDPDDDGPSDVVFCPGCTAANGGAHAGVYHSPPICGQVLAREAAGKCRKCGQEALPAELSTDGVCEDCEVEPDYVNEGAPSEIDRPDPTHDDEPSGEPEPRNGPPSRTPTTGGLPDSPAMRQYHRFKQQHPGCVLFFKMADYYELFGEDAGKASQVLGLRLSFRGSVNNVCIPAAQLEISLRRMILAGHRCAVCEQVEDPKISQGKAVERDVTRVLTPPPTDSEADPHDDAPTGAHRVMRAEDAFSRDCRAVETGGETSPAFDRLLADVTTQEPSKRYTLRMFKRGQTNPRPLATWKGDNFNELRGIQSKNVNAEHYCILTDNQTGKEPAYDPEAPRFAEQILLDTSHDGAVNRRQRLESLRQCVKASEHAHGQPVYLRPYTAHGADLKHLYIEAGLRCVGDDKWITAQAPATSNPMPAKLRDWANGLQKTIDDKRQKMTANSTPKRLAQYKTRLIEADDLERGQTAMRVLADLIDTDSLPDVLRGVKWTKAEILSLVHKGIDASKGGYYDRVARQDYQNTSERGKALQILTDGAGKATDDLTEARKIDAMERDAMLSNIPGFFPTPRTLAQRMAEEADIRPGMSVLEPSAGTGRIADAIQALYPVNPKTRLSAIDLTCVEYNSRLAEIVSQKHATVNRDFLDDDCVNAKYDRIVMNPPFERGQDIDHVRHAYDLLKPGGRVVAIMSEGVFFRSDRKASDFREWLDGLNGTSEKLPPGSFKESGTGVPTRLVIIDKPCESKSLSTVYTPTKRQVEAA